MELKLDSVYNAQLYRDRSNCTFMELKRGW